jgi:tetratricopeptide (TPR) repeat protein
VSHTNDPSLEVLRRGVARWPEKPEHRESLALALAQNGQVSEAIPHFQAIVRLAPDSANAYFNLGSALLQLNRFAESEEAFRAYLHRRPHSAQALSNLGTALIGLGRYSDAESVLQRALMRDPKMTEAFANLGTVQTLRGRYGDAEQTLRNGLGFSPKHLSMLVKLGWVLIRRGAWSEAESVFTEALAMKSRSLRAIAGLATVLERKGQLESALGLLESRIDGGHVLPVFAQAYALVCLGLNQPEKALVMVERCLQSLEPGEGQAGLLHEYGNLLNALSRHAEAFVAHTQANHARRQHFDAKAHSRFVAGIKASFSRRCFAALPANPSALEPIFVVGMPRSGTSLVEQILASHSQVFGAGEQGGILHVVGQAPFQMRDRRPFPDCMAAVQAQDLRRFAQAYTESLPAEALVSPRFVDKMPFNFLHLGLISMLFPKAKIVHCVRDPADTCLSVFFQRFSPYYAFSTSLKGLGSYYRDYQALMTHWEEHLPLPIHRVQYEQLVGAPDVEIPQLLQACSLRSEPACSRFWENTRQVDTASYAQVRRPIYTSAVKRSAPYLSHLAPLLAELARE